MTKQQTKYSLGAVPDDSSGTGDPDQIGVTPEMIQAGVSVLYELGGEVSKATLASSIYRAMAFVAQDPSSAVPQEKTDNR